MDLTNEQWAVIFPLIHEPPRRADGRGTKIMAIADRTGLPIAVCTASASPHEVTLVETTLDARFIKDQPTRLMPDRAPVLSGPQVAGCCRPANRVGGDLFQYYPSDDYLWACVADVTGHAMETAPRTPPPG